jgi:hypothetical protein
VAKVERSPRLISVGQRLRILNAPGVKPPLGSISSGMSGRLFWTTSTSQRASSWHAQVHWVRSIAIRNITREFYNIT